jgi:phosphoenolpyruvate carboxylase
MRIMPWLYSWRNRSKLYRWYGELKYLELEVSEHPQTNRISDYYAKLDHLEASVKKINVPLAFYRELYILREHIELVRERVIRLDQRAASKPLLLSTEEHSGEKS